METTRNTEYWTKLPAELHPPLKVGKYIPRLVVTETDGKTVVAALDYSTYKANPKATLRDLKRKL